MKPITKQLAIAAFILALVTVLSFGIRQVRFSVYRADSGQSTPSDRASDSEGQNQPQQPLNAYTETDHYPAGSYTIDDEHDSQYADASYWDEEMPTDDISEENTDPVKYDKAASRAKSFKGGYAKSEGKNGPQKISLSEYENIYITETGEAWYVGEQPDGSVSKIQVQVVDITGEITFVGGGYYGKSGGSQDLQGISMGDNDNIYITVEGEAWYTSEQPDGSTAKVQLEEGITGEITIVEINEYSDNGEEHATKD